jgi:hypothetical protein
VSYEALPQAVLLCPIYNPMAAEPRFQAFEGAGSEGLKYLRRALSRPADSLLLGFFGKGS